MTKQAGQMIESLIKSLGENPQISPIEGIQAVILGVRKMGLGTEDCRGMLTALKGYFDVREQPWAEIVLFCLRDIPEIGDGTRRELTRPV